MKQTIQEQFSVSKLLKLGKTFNYFHNNFMTCKYILILALLAILSSCRKFETAVPFSSLKQHDGWYYIEKFKFLEGYARFEVQLYVRGKAKSKSNHQVYIQGIPESKWAEEQEKKCKNSINMPVYMKNLRMTGQKINDVFQFSVAQNQTYHFVIKDCLQLFRKDYDNQNAVLHIKFHAFNNDVKLDDAPDKVNEEEESAQIIEEEAVSEHEEEENQAESGVNQESGLEAVASEGTESSETVEQSAEVSNVVQQSIEEAEVIQQSVQVQPVNEVVESQEEDNKVEQL